MSLREKIYTMMDWGTIYSFRSLLHWSSYL